MDKEFTPKTLMKVMYDKGISSELGVIILRVVLYSGDNPVLIKQFIELIQKSETEEEILQKIKEL